MNKFIKPEIKISEFDKEDVIVASGTVEEAKTWMSGGNGSGAVSTSNIADFAGIF